MVKKGVQKYCLPHNTILSGFQGVYSWMYCKTGYWAGKRRADFPFGPTLCGSWNLPPFCIQVSFPWPLKVLWNFNNVLVGLLETEREKAVVSWLLIMREASILVAPSAKGFPLASAVSAFQWPDILTRASAHGGRTASHNSATCFPFLIGHPEDVRNPLFPKHSKIMCRSQTTAAVCVDTGRLSSCQLTHPGQCY